MASFTLSHNLGEASESVAAASASDPTAHVELTVNAASITNKTDLLKSLEAFHKKIVNADWPPA